MLESLFFHNINMIGKANTCCPLCITVNIKQVVSFNTIRYGSVFIPTVHNLDISEFWFLSTYPAVNYIYTLFSLSYFSIFHICKNFFIRLN